MCDAYDANNKPHSPTLKQLVSLDLVVLNVYKDKTEIQDYQSDASVINAIIGVGVSNRHAGQNILWVEPPFEIAPWKLLLIY